jgi:hypothetical protein
MRKKGCEEGTRHALSISLSNTHTHTALTKPLCAPPSTAHVQKLLYPAEPPAFVRWPENVTYNMPVGEYVDPRDCHKYGGAFKWPYEEVGEEEGFFV